MKKEQCVTFGKRLSELRTDKGLTQIQLAETTKIQRVTIAKYERGERAPSIDNLLAFVDYFGVSSDYLLGLSNIKSNNPDISSACDYTGLSEDAILSIKDTLSHADSIYEVSKESYIRSINQLLMNDGFYHALYLLTLLKKASITAIDREKSEPSVQLHKSIDDYYRKKISFENENVNNNCDFLKYKISSDFERITALFDMRAYDKQDTVLRDIIIKEESTDNAKHTSKKE